MIICLISMTVILNGVSLEYLDCDQAKSKPNTNGMAGIFAMITSMIFVGFFALGPGPVPWIVTGEFYTQSHRSAAVAIGTCANWGGSLLVAIIFPQLQTRMASYSFLPFVIVLVLLFLILFFYMPETHGVPVNEVESLFQVDKFDKAEKILKGSLDSIRTPPVKVRIMGGKVCLRHKGKTLLGIVNIFL